MAANIKNHLNYYLQISAKDKHDLAYIRLWSNVKIAFDEDKIWAKDFDFQQITSLEVKSIPYKVIFDEHDGKLHLHGSLLPERNMPSLLWTAIDRALPVTMPSLNHNFFGIEEAIEMQLIPSEKVVKSVAMITDIASLDSYIQTAPAIRLQNLHWVMLDKTAVFLLGTPLLPIEGQVFWQEQDFLIPAGYDFQLSILKNKYNQLINPTGDKLIIWHKDNTCFGIEKADVQPLSLSSFRLTHTTP